MYAGIADRRRGTHHSGATGTTDDAISPTLTRRCATARSLRKTRIALMLGLTAVLALRIGQACAQDAAMLDDRVTPQSVGETICRPGYADTVAPPFDQMTSCDVSRLDVATGGDRDSAP